MTQTIDNKIRRGFSEAAKEYDRFSGLHREIADKLLAQISKETTPLALLDVGCGTGYLTGKVKDCFPQSRIVGLDFAEGMLKMARCKRKDVSWVLADGNHLPFLGRRFDIVISNLAYQWAGDLSRAFSEARRVLLPNGVFACTLFGYNTCQELFQSLSEVKAGAVQFTRLPEAFQVREALVISGFKDPVIDSARVKIEFKDMYDLITWLRAIGANTLARKGYVGKEAMIRAAAIYGERFFYRNGVQATFEVIRVYVKK